MNYGQRGCELLLELTRSDWLPPYNDEGVRATIQEASLHLDELNDQVAAATAVANATGEIASSSRAPAAGSGNDNKLPMESRPSLVIHNAAIRRNKRCLLAYHNYRINKLRALRWETNGVIPSSIRSLLSEPELDFWTDYDKLVSRYSAAIDLDLSSDQSPPVDEWVLVRVVRGDLGRIDTSECGPVLLELGTTHNLPRGDVEHLIRQGAVVQLDGEENL